MVDLYEYTTPELVRRLGERFKDYRMRCNLTQKEVAERSGIGLTTIHKFENGSAGNISLSTFILLLKVVGQINALDDVLPELPEKSTKNPSLKKVMNYGENIDSDAMGRGNRSLSMGRKTQIVVFHL